MIFITILHYLHFIDVIECYLKLIDMEDEVQRQ